MRRLQGWIVGLEASLGLGVAVLAALVVGRATSLWIDGRLAPATAPIPPRGRVTPAVPDTDVVLAALARVAPESPDAGARPALRVWGVAMHADERLAVVEDASGAQHLRRTGDVVDGSTVVEIAWDGVTIERDGRRLHLPLETRPAEGAEGSAKATDDAAPPAPAAPSRIRQVSDDSFLVDRALLLGEVGNMSALLAQLRAVPEVEDGAPIGFRVFSISDDSIFRRLGLRDGDVVRRVNGSTLHDPAALLAFLQGMGDESRIALDLVRAGRPSTLVYDLR